MITALRFEALKAGQPSIVGTAVLRDGQVEIKTTRKELDAELRRGVLGPDKKWYTPDDGEKFLLAAMRQYSGTYLRAVPQTGRSLGGPGSGNFGHSGRPGEQGGSGGESDGHGPSYAPHTVEERHQALYTRGYHNGRTGYGFQKGAAGRKGTAGHDAYRQGYDHGVDDSHEPDVVPDPAKTVESILGKDRKKLTIDAVNHLSKDQLQQLDRAYGSLAKAAMSPAVRMGHTATQRMIQSRLKGLGGAGSGNFGHSGRPGEVGGSSSDSGGGESAWKDPGGHEHSGVTWTQPTDPKTGRPIPIKVSNVEDAAKLVAEGKVVEVPDVKSAHTLIEKLAAMATEAKAAGKEAKAYDLCQVSVAGTNMFCTESLRNKDYPTGVPRSLMPQLGGKPEKGSEADQLEKDKDGKVDGTNEFVSYLRGIGMRTTKEEVPSAGLRATQRQLRGQVVGGMMTNKTYDPGKKPIFVSDDNYVVDGHHRWAASVGRDAEDGVLGDSKMHVIRIHAPISEVLHLANAWSKRFGIKQAGMEVS